MFEDFGCKVGDTLFVAVLDLKKICEFEVDCLKVFSGDFTAHGYIYGKYGKYGAPTEFSLKKLNKRVIFTNKILAVNWMNNYFK